MEIYLVGGAVRDKLLNLPVTDRDWVVVGATEAQLLEQGYTSVGKDFPVFLHPKTKEEYALARIERKTGKGHRGFICDANANVSLEEDLKRRDLTINAIAETQEGQLIDPFNGVQDIKDRIFRHVSDAFSEDPLRVIRLARFSARFPEFTIHKDTELLMKAMVARDELSELAAERIYAEIDKALACEHPQLFFSVMEQVGAHTKIYPEITPLGISLLEKISTLTSNKAARLAALFWPNNTVEVKQLGKRLKLPGQLVELAELSSLLFKGWQLPNPTTGETIVNWFYQADAFRRKDRFIRLNQLFGLMSRVIQQPDYSEKWLEYFNLAETIKARDLISQYSGPELGQALRKAQANVIKNSGKL